MAKVVFENVYKSFPAQQRALLPRSRPPGQKQLNQAQKAAIAAERLPNSSSPEMASRVSVLRRINLSVEDGEFMVLVGPSGCGKSTLLRLLAGLEELTGGNIRVGDRSVAQLPPKARDIAMVFQSYALYPHLSVYDNLAFGLRRMPSQREDWRPSSAPASMQLPPWLERGLTAGTRSLPKPLRYRPAQEQGIEQQIRQVAQMLQIDGLLNRLPKELSGGQKQRVALGRAIARNPQVFLMDEPLSNLDAKLRAETRTQIVNLQRQLGTTTLYVTHDQVEAMTMGQRIAVMAAGEIQQVGAPLDLYHRPANQFVAGFIGSPPMNFIPVTLQAPALVVHEQFRFTLPERWAPLVKPYDGRRLVLGIRPEHLTWGAAATKNLQVRVAQVEALGSETFIAGMLAQSGVEIQARVEADHSVQLGETVWLSPRLDRLHLFEPDTGTALLPLE